MYLKHLNEHKKLYNISEECFCLVSTAPFSKLLMRSWPLAGDQFLRVILDDLLHAQSQAGVLPELWKIWFFTDMRGEISH